MSEFETVRRVIAPQDCDILGHLNVSKYFEIVSDGGFSISAELGLDRAAYTTGRRQSFVVVHSESHYRAELLAGDRVLLRSALVEVGGKSALFRHRLYRLGDDHLCFETRFRTVLMDLDQRRAIAIPPDLRARMEEIVIEDDQGETA